MEYQSTHEEFNNSFCLISLVELLPIGVDYVQVNNKLVKYSTKASTYTKCSSVLKLYFLKIDSLCCMH